MTASNFVLIHSPLVGPSTWVRVAEQLEGRGHWVAVPDLVGALVAGPPYWEAIAGRVWESEKKPGWRDR